MSDKEESLSKDTPESDQDRDAQDAQGDEISSSAGPPRAPVPPATGPTLADLGSFEDDPALAAAMAEAEAFANSRTKSKKAVSDAFAIEDDADSAGDDSGFEIPIESAAPAKGKPPMPTGAGEGLVRALSQLRETMEKLEAVSEEKQQFQDRYLRAQADLENFKKRTLREQEQAKKFANEGLVKDLLPVLDNLGRALELSDASAEQVRTGVQMVQKSLVSTLSRFGVEPFSALHQPFDPERMEAMQQVESAEHPPSTVVQEFMCGYFLNGRLVRPAMVIVSKAPSTPTPMDTPADRSIDSTDQEASSDAPPTESLESSAEQAASEGQEAAPEASELDADSPPVTGGDAS